MKRVPRDDGRFDLIRLLDDSARKQGVNLSGEDAGSQLLATLSSVVDAARAGGTLVHGLHAEAMFAHVAAALGECAMVKSEDAGALYLDDTAVRIPDYRVITRAGRQLLVEVKNHHPKDLRGAFKIKRNYLSDLKKYAQLVGAELYIAVYWSHWQMWSLVHCSRLEGDQPSFSLSFPDAMKWNELALLGDRMLGTTPPLALRLLSTADEPRFVGEDGAITFTIGDVQLLAGGEILEDETEKKIAWFLMMYGTWTAESTPTQVVDGELISVDFELRPLERANPDQDFELIGFMSQMLSREYLSMTSDSEGVTCIVPDAQPHDLGVVIPADYQGQQLHLWRLEIQTS